MTIDQIRIEDVVTSTAPGLHCATVILKTDISSLCLRATTKSCEMRPANDIQHALVMDAIRQLRRMPEYRSGIEQVTVSDQAWSDLDHNRRA